MGNTGRAWELAEDAVQTVGSGSEGEVSFISVTGDTTQVGSQENQLGHRPPPLSQFLCF